MIQTDKEFFKTKNQIETLQKNLEKLDDPNKIEKLKKHIEILELEVKLYDIASNGGRVEVDTNFEQIGFIVYLLRLKHFDNLKDFSEFLNIDELTLYEMEQLFYRDLTLNEILRVFDFCEFDLNYKEIII